MSSQDQLSRRVDCPEIDWEKIRHFLIHRKFCRGIVSESTFNLIRARNTKGLPSSLKRELSVYICGYLRAKA